MFTYKQHAFKSSSQAPRADATFHFTLFRETSFKAGQGFLNKMLYRKYYNAQKAIENINTNTSITENQIGFKTLEEIVKAKLISFNPKHKDTLIKAKIVRLGLPMGSFMQSSGGAKQFIGGRLISARNDTIAFGDMDYEYLTNEVDKLKKDRNYQYNLILFITGILLMILGKD